MKIDKQLQELETYYNDIDKRNEKISYSSIGWQIDHSLKVVNASSSAYLTSGAKKYKPKFSFVKFFILTFKYIPRGKSKAPKLVNNKESITLLEIEEQMSLAKENLAKVAQADEGLYFKHPIFGHLNKKEYTNFLEIHTEHHLKIIKDILKSN